jgi:putative hydrolase of HD superfamily
MKDDLTKIVQFISYSAQLRNIYRANNATFGRKESVAEHSWHLALVAWLLHAEFEKEFKINISLEKTMKMCLMHDLVEIEVGDASSWTPKERSRKALKENAAAIKIFSKLPKEISQEFLNLWDEFENAQTIESKIARGIDRLNPTLMRVLTQQGWDKQTITVKDVDKMQLPRIQFSRVLTLIYKSLRQKAITKGFINK